MTEFRFTSVAAELNSKFGQLHNEYGESTPIVEIVMDNGQGHYPSWAVTGDLFN